MPALELIYHEKICEFVQRTWILGLKYTRLLPCIAILGEVSGLEMGEQYQKLPSASNKLIQQAITQ